VPDPSPSPDGRKRILLTGASGRLGQVLRQGLERDYVVRGLDVRGGPGVDVVADMRKLKRIRPAFEGVDAIIDLAAIPSPSLDWQRVLENNVAATLNAFEAARLAGVRRVVYASSNHVTGMYERDEPFASVLAGEYDGLDSVSLPRFGGDVPIRPDGPYGVGKALGEAAARYYADEFGLSVICLRIGYLSPEDRPNNPREFSVLLTRTDLVQLIRRCLEAPPSLRFAVFYGVSANTWRIWDIEPARTAIGYEPQDDAERFR
jgi:nucleoside-diphosphate-sugar epimerase